MQFRPLFPSFVLVDQLENDLDNDTIVNFCYDRYKMCPRQKWEGGWSSGHLDLDLLNDNPLKPLYDIITNRINRVKEEIGVKVDTEHRIANYWININEPGHYQLHNVPPHVHPNYFLNCVYYPKAEQGAGNLALMAPFNGIEFTIPYKFTTGYNPYNSPREIIRPEPAKLVIFPSWLYHYVSPNTSQVDRISMAFNIALPHVEV
jgi:uncharacterized protein (TIGR02466 family)